MSGGTFDYQQHHIYEMAERVKEDIQNDRCIKPWCSINPWDLDEETGRLNKGVSPYYSEYSKETLYLLLKTFYELRMAYELAHHTDYLLAGDIGEQTYAERCATGTNQVLKEVGELRREMENRLENPEPLDGCCFCQKFRNGPHDFWPICSKTRQKINDPLQSTCGAFKSYFEIPSAIEPGTGED